MINLYQGKDCSGCTACVFTCPVDCITMKADKEGFLYPDIDTSKCIECKACLKVCPFNNTYKNENSTFNTKVYAAKHADEEIRLKSSSGGMFIAISDFILDKGGVIYGATYDQDFRVIHSNANTKSERNGMIGSKYVQSNLGDTYLLIEKDLNKDLFVLFTGTPCQTAGLYAYLKKEYEKLYVVDILCHNVPSPVIYNEFLNKQKEISTKLQITDINFRSKEGVGWRCSSRLLFHFNDSSKKEEAGYLTLFYKGLISRPSCHNCKFTNTRRSSDVTIGDYWKINKYHPEFDDDRGVSCLFLNSYKGVDLFNEISDKLIFIESNIEDAKQGCLTRPTSPSVLRDKFWDDYSQKGFKYIEKKYCDFSKWDSIKANKLAPLARKTGISEVRHFFKNIIK